MIEEERPAGMTNKKQPKYFDIIDAVNQLSSTRYQVQRLCDKICGVKEAPLSDCDKNPETKYCLLEVLDQTPGDIQAECNLIEKAIEEIRAQIL